MEEHLLAREERFEPLISGMIEQGFGSLDSFISGEIVSGLRVNLIRARDAGIMNPAGIGRKFDYQKNTLVRGDEILWLEKGSKDPFEQAFFEQVEAFIQYLNRSCYTGINDYEFHYAYYEPGSFYKRHLDQFKSNRSRKFSLVTYLNQDWKAEDGGRLSLYFDDGEKEILPIGGRSVFFKSDEIEHEVHIAPNRYRLSIAGWLKQV